MQTARIAYLSWKIEIGRNWYRSQIGRDSGAKVKMCTPVHGLSVCLIAERPESPCTGVHIFIFAPQSHPIWLLYQSRPISIFQLKKGCRADCHGAYWYWPNNLAYSKWCVEMRSNEDSSIWRGNGSEKRWVLTGISQWTVIVEAKQAPNKSQILHSFNVSDHLPVPDYW